MRQQCALIFEILSARNDPPYSTTSKPRPYLVVGIICTQKISHTTDWMAPLDDGPHQRFADI